MLTSFKNPFKKDDKPPVIKQKKPMSSFTIFIIFMSLLFGIIGALFAVFTLNNPDVIKFVSNINPSSIIYVIVMGFVAFIVLSFIIGTLSYFLFDVNGSTIFWLFIHLLLLVFCSPYFLIVLIWGTYTFSIAEIGKIKLGSSSKKGTTELDGIILEEKGFFSKNFGKMNLFGTPKTDAQRMIISAEKKRIADEKKRIANEKRIAEGKGKGFSFNMFGKKGEDEVVKKKEPLRKVAFFNVLGGGGDEDEEPSSLEKFMNILSETDGKMISLWKLLLFIYTLQDKLLSSSLATFYNKIVHP